MYPSKAYARAKELLSGRVSRRRAANIIILPVLVFTFFFLSRETTHEASFATPPPSPTIKALLDHISPAKTSFKQLVALPGSQRADALAHALDAWKSGPLPAAVSVAAAVCNPRDAADAVLRGDLAQVTVLDVGAEAGLPVTRIALDRAARLVVSIEPDRRSFAKLAALPVSTGRHFAPINGAASETDGRQFLRLRDDVACFDCLDESQDQVTAEEVDVFTVDALLLDGNAKREAKRVWDLDRTSSAHLGVLLFKSNTEGHERQVLEGARRLFATGRVENAIVKFDTGLLGSKENALQTLQQLFQAGLSCTQLAFVSLTEQEKTGAVYPFFGRVAITSATAERFYDFVKSKEKATDILCSKR